VCVLTASEETSPEVYRDRQENIFNRQLAPFVAGVLVFGNYFIQGHIARANAERVVQACKRYRDDNGAYPKQLTDLVPHYLSSVPHAKYCLAYSDFLYSSLDQTTMLFWVNTPPYGTRLYDFQRDEWGGVN
jgi:hypothetical protein